MAEKENLLTRRIAERRYDGECTGDYILPDTVADIQRVLRVSADVLPGGCFADGDRLEFEGKAVYSVLIVTEDGRLVRLHFEEPFEDAVEIEGLESGAIFCVRPEAGALNWRLSNPRRLNIRLKLHTYVKVSRRVRLIPDTSACSPAELACDCTTVPSLTVCCGEAAGKLSEDIELEGSLPQLGEIIDCRLTPSVTECKCGDGSVACRGEIMVSLLYRSDEGEGRLGEPVFTVRHLPFMQSVEIDEAAPDCHALAYARCGLPHCEIGKNGYGEARMLSVDLDYTVYAECAVTAPVTLLRDAYSTAHITDTEREVLTLERLERCCSTNFSVNAAASRKETGAERADRAVDAEVDVSIDGFRPDRERGKLILEGTAAITVVTQSLPDADGSVGFDSHAFSCPLRFELDGAGSENASFRCVPTVTMVRVRLDPGSLYCDFEVALTLFAVASEEAETVSRLTVREPIPEKRESVLRLCYPTAEETLWQVARRYHTTCQAIAAANALNEADGLPDTPARRKHSVLLIPNG